jgi:hypothetical protein
MEKLNIDINGNFNIDGSNADVVPIGEPIITWFEVGRRQEVENMCDLFNGFSRKACSNIPADCFVLGESFFVGKNIEQCGIQFYKFGNQPRLSLAKIERNLLHHLNFNSNGQFLLANDTVNAIPIGTPIVTHYPVDLRKILSTYPIELAKFARQLGFENNSQNAPNAFTFGNSIDTNSLSYVAAQFYRI